MPVNAPQIPPRWQGILWGILPFGSSILAILVILLPEKRREPGMDQAIISEENLAQERLVS
jgi:hypothetical protein